MVAGEDQIDTLADIDDHEVEGYLLSADERKLKTLIWDSLNKDWLEEQETKKKIEKKPV